MSNGAHIEKVSSASPSSVSVKFDRARLLDNTYQRCWKDLCRYIRSNFGAGPPDPEDVVQQAFVQFAALDDPASIRNPKAFLCRTAHNIAVSDKRRAQTRHRNFTALKHDLDQGDDLTPERAVMGKDELRLIKGTLEAMPRKRRRLLLLHRVHGLSYAEISRRMGLSQTAVKKHVAKAMIELDMALEAAQ